MDVNIRIPVFIINLKSREERKEHIEKQFASREEFATQIIEPLYHEFAIVSLWNTIKHILGNLVSDADEFIILCEDDHQFTADYSKEFLIQNILKAEEKKADILCGGISSLWDAVEADNNLFWVNKFSGLQFTIIFRSFYEKILHSSFSLNDTADYRISDISNNKFVIYPFISTQKDFGYSDVTHLNNGTSRVEELFMKSSACFDILNTAKQFYGKHKNEEENITEVAENISIPTYIINLKERSDRLAHIQKQFIDKPEFALTIVDACKHTIGAVGLWQSVCRIIELAINNDDDVIVICEDDHEFTGHYSREYLLENIIEAHEQGVEILSGGVGGFGLSLPVSKNRIWMNWFFCTQFIVLYRSIFQKILDTPFDDTVTADGMLSIISSRKMTLFPFISVQKEFGYSDVTAINNEKGAVSRWFINAENRLKEIEAVYSKFNPRQ